MGVIQGIFVGHRRGLEALVRAVDTLALRLVEGMTGPEIAERTGLTHGSVRVNLHRGMKMLREKLEAQGRVTAEGRNP